ncbi:MAG: O-antigen ligase family protein [Gammaproteobacteria bacterium]
MAFLVLLVWIPIPFGSNRPLPWALLEVWVFLMAAVWLIKYARGRVTLTEPFRQARPALILFVLWLSYGLLQMMPLPVGVVAVLSPHTAALHQQAHLAPRLAHLQLVANPVVRPLPSFPGLTTLGDRAPTGTEAQAVDTGQAENVPDPSPSEDDHRVPGFADRSAAAADTRSAVTTHAHSARLSLDLSASITAWLKSLAYVLLFALTLLLIDSTQKLKMLAIVLVLSGLGQAVYGSLSLAMEGGGVASGSFINRNHYAAYLVLCLTVGIGLLIAMMGQGTGAGSWRHRVRHIGKLILSSRAPLRIFLAIMVIALVLTHSRMGNIAFFVSLLIAGTLALVLLKDMPRPVVILITSLVLIDILIIGSWVGLEKVTERITQTNLESEARDDFNLNSLRMWQDYPLFGAGAGSYYSVFPRYREGTTSGRFLVDHAHNDYLEFLTEYGLLGMLLPAGVVILALRNTILVLRRRRSQFAKGIGFAGLMAITAMLIHATVEFNLHIPAYAATFMVILATTWLARYLASDRSTTVASSISVHLAGTPAGKSALERLRTPKPKGGVIC